MTAQELSAHMRAVRGYRWAMSGYHATGQGFWLSAAYYGDGLFLVDGSRNHGGGRVVNLLVQAFRSKLVQPDNQGMLDPALYASEVVHLSCSAARGGAGQAGYPAQPAVQPVAAAGPAPRVHRGVPPAHDGDRGSGAPSASRSAPAPAPPAIVEPAAPRALRLGDVCPICGAEVKERPLFWGRSWVVSAEALARPGPGRAELRGFAREAFELPGVGEDPPHHLGQHAALVSIHERVIDGGVERELLLHRDLTATAPSSRMAPTST